MTQDVPPETPLAGYATVWEFRVRSERREEFERHYGLQGSWVDLFRQAAGYLGTELLRDRADPLRYLTIDRWTGADAYRAFRTEFARPYAILDAACEGLTTQEIAIGEYDLGSAPP
jgi:quinol monooxygenase YgiN